MRMVFVVGRNPYMVSDGTGVAHDTDAIKAELEVNDDIVRVEAVHKDGTDGRSELMHDVWRVLPRKFHAHFYAKAQVRGQPRSQPSSFNMLGRDAQQQGGTAHTQHTQHSSLLRVRAVLVGLARFELRKPHTVQIVTRFCRALVAWQLPCCGEVCRTRSCDASHYRGWGGGYGGATRGDVSTTHAC